MKVLDHVIDLMSFSGEEKEAGQKEGITMMMLTALMSLVVLLLII